MKKLAPFLFLIFLLALTESAKSQGSTAEEAVVGFLSSATTGAQGCKTLGMGNPPCFIQFSATQPMVVTTTGSVLTLTTSGTSGASTYGGGVLNIPVYSGGSGSSSLSALTSATTTNSIDNAGFAQTWNWSTLGANTGLLLNGTTTGAGKAFSSTITGASNTGYAGYFSNTATTGWAVYANGAFTDTGVTTLGALTTGALSANGTGVISSGTLAVSNGGTGASSAGITAFNNITGYSAAGTTGTTSTNLVFSTSPTLTTPNIGAATGTSFNNLTVTTSGSVGAITNGYFDTAASGNTLKINGTAITAVSGTGAVCLASGSSCSGGSSQINLGSLTTANPQISGDVTSGFYTAGAGLVDVAISGSKITEWASTGVTNTGTNTSNSFIPTSSTIPTDGYYLKAANISAVGDRSLEVIEFTNPASAVNFWKFTGSATGVAPSVTIGGTDTTGNGLGMTFTALAATATGNGGAMTFTGSSAFGVGTGGNIALTAGGGKQPLSSSGASLTLAGGVSTGAGGAVTLQGGQASIGGTSGIVTIQSGVSNGGSASTVTIKGSNASSGANTSGDSVTITGGNSTTGGGVSTAGAVTITAGAGGASATTDGNPGGISSLTGGAGGTTNNAGGLSRVVGGAGAGSRAGGAAQVTGGAGGATGTGGAVTITSGAGGATSGVAGDVVLQLGATTSSAGGTLPSIDAAGFLAFTTTQAAIATKTGVHQTTANILCLTTTGSDSLCQQSSGGILIGSPTGGDKGAATINATGIYQAGTQAVDTCGTGLSKSGTTCNLATSGTANVPLVGSAGTPTCGTGCASITAGSTDQRGSMVSGSSVSAVTVNWSTTLASAPFCVISDSNTTATADISSVSSSALTVSLASALTSVTIYWVCPL